MFSRPHRVGDTGLIALLALAIAGLVRADDMVFPKKDWEQVAPESEGVDSARLVQAVTYLQTHTGRDGVRELLMVRNGRVIWQGDNAHKVHNVWSCTKSFTSTVLGLLIDDGNWWCNGKDADGQLRWPDAPAGTFAAEGHNNNRCFVIPEWRMVIVRLGLDAGDHRTTSQEWSEFLGLVGKAHVALEP